MIPQLTDVARFWDWSLDWEDPPSSPIFDSKLGFGGDGDPNAPVHNSAHCVTDSPLMNLNPQWYGVNFDPHCLSRWFDEDDWFGRYLSPTVLEEVMSSESYEEFFLALERGPHDIIPGGIRGDFTSFTAPNGKSASCLKDTKLLALQVTNGRRSYLLLASLAAGSCVVALADARQREQSEGLWW